MSDDEVGGKEMQDGGHHRVAEEVAACLEVRKVRKEFHLGRHGFESESDELACKVLGPDWLS